VRTGDVVARQSGDEFLVLLRDLKRPEDAGIVARKIIEAINQPVQLGETTVNVGASIGIAILNDTNPTLEQLLRAADTAMYAAKERGRNLYQFYSDAFYERVQRKLTLEQELRQALARKELSLVYQPTIDLQSGGRIRGIETLLRWTGPDGEARSPAEFIPIAEDCGEIVPIGRWVLEQACRQARAWDLAGFAFDRIAVNVSAIQLRDADFASAVIDICERCDWPTERLELELTESALMRDSEVLRRSFALFETHGVSLSVDDFGTGFSNLHYLHRFPVKHLKIDRSFVLHLLEDRQIERLSEAIVGLGHALRLRVVAEGVESEAAARLLRQLGCDEAQGFLYTRPLPAYALEQWAQETGRY
jgi:predicted signal transduction protein with EAL and GGDEF domain